MKEIPSQIGPYKVLEPLGAGGMGEVLLAHDERLDRKVAIKRIRRDTASPGQRERFRREARLAARLSHFAIVQVYDLVTEEDVDNLVMEYVEGTNLRILSRPGPLPVAKVLDLGIQIAQGLREAHRHGIVHRDLKTENVLVTPEGRAKIADFGVAKRLADAWTEESLTRTDAVIGTYRTMSPEQARGGPVDHRSDLFAFGVLLYELLTGQSPFRGDNPLATLDQIIHHRQAPVREIAPSVPEGLSRLVDRLLEKEPGLRPRSAGEVVKDLEQLAGRQVEETGTATLMDVPPASQGTAAPRPDSSLEAVRRWPRSLVLAVGLIVLAAALGGGYYVLRGPEEPLYVAVLEPEVVTDDPAGGFDLLASAVHSALLRGLLDLEGISPKAADEVAEIEGPPVQVARAVAADEVVHSRLECRLETCRVSLKRLKGEDEAVLWTESFEVPADDFYLVANAVAGQIQQGYEGYPARRGHSRLEVTGEELKRFTRLRKRFDARGEDLGALMEEAAAIRTRSPRFLDAYLLEADIARHSFHHSRNPEDLARAFERVEEARELAPGSPEPLLKLVDVALAGKELERAEQALEELRSLIPGDVRVVSRQAHLMKNRGEINEAIELLRSAALRHPSWKRLAALARMEHQAGQIDAARDHLQLLLSRSPGNFEGLSLLAQIELANGSAARAASLYEQIVRRTPGPTELANLSIAYFLLGRHADAARILEGLMQREPRNPFYALNLGDAYTLLGEAEKGRRLYRKVLELTDSDPGGSSAEVFSLRAQALAHLGEGTLAVAAIQEALRLSPDSAGIAYEASVVYAVLGETSSALVNAEKALRLGYEARWFDFPWFNGLRRHSAFRDLLRRHAS